jgi:hypothetical protein
MPLKCRKEEKRINIGALTNEWKSRFDAQQGGKNYKLLVTDIY